MASEHDAGGSRAKIEYALGLLTTLLRNHPVHQELVDVAHRMDLPDELWLAVQILSMSEPDQAKLKRVNRSTLVLTQESAPALH